MSNKTSNSSNRSPVTHRTVQSKSDRFWNFYSRLLIRFPWVILVLSLLVTVSLSICFLRLMRTRIFDQTDFLVRNGPAVQNIQRIHQLFGNDKGLRVHQQTDLYPALDIIIRRKSAANNDTNLLDNQIIDEIRALDRRIQSIRINSSANTRQYNYSSLCTVLNKACVIDGNYLLSDQFRQAALNLQYIPNGIYIDSLTGANGLAAFIFSKHYKTKNITMPDSDYVDPDEEDAPDEEEEEEEEEAEKLTTPSNVKETISFVPIFRLRYALDTSTEQSRLLALTWEQEVARELNENYHSSLLSLSLSISTSITDTITKQAHSEGPFLAIMLIIFFIFVCFFISIQGSFHTSVGYLSLCGIVNIALSSGATFGLLALFRVEIIEPISFLVFAVALLDCMRTSIVCGEYHRTIQEYLPRSSTARAPSKIDLEKVVRSILRSTRACFVPATLITVFVYLLMALLSPMACTKHLGLILILYMLINHLTHGLFFTSCLVITLQRILSHRHCLFCYHLPTDYHVKVRRKSTGKSLRQKRKEVWKAVHPLGKKLLSGGVCLLSILFVIISIWLVLSIDTRLFDEQFLPRNAASIRSYMRSQVEDYDLGPVIMFVVPQPINYQNPKTREAIGRVLSQCMSEPTASDFKLSWLDYEDIKVITTGKDALALRISPYSQNDLVVRERKNQSRSSIQASRFYCQFKSITGNRQDLQIMNHMYKYAEESTIPALFPYSIIFPHYESLQRIRTEVSLLIAFMVLLTTVITFLIFRSWRKTLFICLHLLILLSGNLACLSLFHRFTLNFANALWLFVLPIIYLDAIIHASLNIRKSKWKYNRVMLSIVLALGIFSFFPVQTYIFHVIRNSLLYQALLCLLIINVSLPSWNDMLRTRSSKQKTARKQLPVIIESNQAAPTQTEIQNLVHEPNAHSNGAV